MKHQQTLNRFILIGIVFAVVFLANYFAYFDDIVRYIPIWTVIFVFYLPIQITLSYSIFHWFKTKTRVETTRARIGIFVMLVAAVLQTIVSVVYFTELIDYPNELWFVAVLSSRIIPLLQSINIIALISGIFLVYKDCIDNRKEYKQTLKESKATFL